MSDEFALAFLCNYNLTPTDRQLKRPSGSLTSSYGIITDMPFWYNDVKIRLNFRIFEDLNFDFLIGHPLKALFSGVPKDGCLNIKLGKDTFHIPVDRALTCSVEDLPIPEPIEEIMATSTFEFFDLGLEEDIEEMPEEVSDAEEESGETSELLATEKPSRPPIELKPLPSGLRYAFLNSDVESPVIISDKLLEEETNKLIAVLEKHRSVLGYTLQDLKGISPALCTHRIPLDPAIAPSREPQGRLNNSMREVVKKEVLKLLNAGIIYPVPHSEWVSLVQVVPKKGGMTVVENSKNELIPQRAVTGWRMCIDYRKLNKATKKDHSPGL